jgi:ubiquinone/menaquinone biosynthesis C-methylase UbiE
MQLLDDNPNLKRVWRYYDHTESRVGYKYLLGGTKHFGWYESGQPMWDFRPALRRMEDELGKRLGLDADASVLDAGCGMGDVARTMATKYGLRVTGIDILDFNLDEARKRSATAGLESRTTFQLGDYHSLPFPAASFDGVYTMETFVHAADPAKALDEFRRVLRPGGRLVMFEYSHAPEAEMSRDASQALRRICDLGVMPTWLKMNDGDMEALLKREGFVVEAADNVSERIVPMLHAFSILGRFPYFLGRILGQVPKVVNTMSGVELYKHRDVWHYNIYTASKPA